MKLRKTRHRSVSHPLVPPHALCSAAHAAFRRDSGRGAEAGVEPEIYMPCWPLMSMHSPASAGCNDCLKACMPYEPANAQALLRVLDETIHSLVLALQAAASGLPRGTRGGAEAGGEPGSHMLFCLYGSCTCQLLSAMPALGLQYFANQHKLKQGRVCWVMV